MVTIMQRCAMVLGHLLLSLTLHFAFTPAVANAEGLLERGTYLVRYVAACGNCHTPKGPQGDIPGRELAGGLKIEEPGFSVITPNITPDPETGIGAWSNAELMRAIRDGKHRDGRTLGPPMPFDVYRNLTDRDTEAIIAYLRSVKPVSNKIPSNTYPFPLPPAWGPPVTSVPDVPENDPIAYGAYLAGPVAHCTVCHTPMQGNRFLYDTHLGAGGLPLHGPWGTVFSANLTPHQQFGIGAWKDGEVLRAIKTGITRNGSPLIPIMPSGYYAGMTDSDAQAIVAYLRTLKPVASERKVRLAPPAK